MGEIEDGRERVRRLEIKERRETLWEIDEGEKRGMSDGRKRMSRRR